MHYGFKRDEPVSEGAHRIVREQVTRALEELAAAEPDLESRVHSVRKRIKKLRGLLRLVAGAAPKAALERADVNLRNAGRMLATARRASVLVRVFDEVCAGSPHELPAAGQAALREGLRRARDAALDSLHSDSHAGDASELLRTVLEDAERFPIAGRDWNVVARGFRRTYRRARRSMQRASKHTTSTNLHEWRKLAKYHFYHVRLLEQTFEAQLAPLVVGLESLTELLGAEHDLDDLRLALIEDAPQPETMEATKQVLDLLALRREEIRRAAFSSGARLFAERPAAAERRFRAYFEAWRTDDSGDDAEADRDDP